MKASGYERAADDYYVEPRWAVEAMLDAVGPINGWIWDPACGGGTIPSACASRGIRAIGTDIVQRAPGFGRFDFLEETQLRAPTIISNPPFRLAEAFVRHALELRARRVVLLCCLAFLEGRERYRELFEQSPPAEVLVHCRRVSMPPGGTDIPARGGSTAFAWYVWQEGKRGEPVLRWLP